MLAKALGVVCIRVSNFLIGSRIRFRAPFDTSIGRVRFFGVDTPERGDKCFTEATDFTRLLVGSQVRLEDGPRLEDIYGRRLAYIYDTSGNSIDVQLIAGGFASAWTRDGQHRDVLIGLEESAKTNNAGCLWGERLP